MSGYIKKIREKIGHDPLLICGATVIIYKDGKVLLQKRKDDGKYGYIGGCVELYEEVEHAARRELFEETGFITDVLENLEVLAAFGEAENSKLINALDLIIVNPIKHHHLQEITADSTLSVLFSWEIAIVFQLLKQ